MLLCSHSLLVMECSLFIGTSAGGAGVNGVNRESIFSFPL